MSFCWGALLAVAVDVRLPLRLRLPNVPVYVFGWRLRGQSLVAILVLDLSIVPASGVAVAVANAILFAAPVGRSLVVPPSPTACLARIAGCIAVGLFLAATASAIPGPALTAAVGLAAVVGFVLSGWLGALRHGGLRIVVVAGVLVLVFLEFYFPYTDLLACEPLNGLEALDFLGIYERPRQSGCAGTPGSPDAVYVAFRFVR